MSTNQNIQLYTDNSAGQRDTKIQVHAEQTPKSTIPRPKTQKYDKLTVWLMPE
ncbi:33367_t:CDS:1, partial [Gigaspora margarita]